MPRKYEKNGFIEGGFLHRDTIPGWDSKGAGQLGEYIIFSCPHNPTYAVTEIVYLKRAIEQLSEEERNDIKVNITKKEKQFWSDPPKKISVNLNELLQLLTIKSPAHDDFVIGIDLITEGALADKFRKMMDDNSLKAYLRSGNVLIVDEKNMFHQAHEGTLKIIHLNPISRYLIHHAGAATGPVFIKPCGSNLLERRPPTSNPAYGFLTISTLLHGSFLISFFLRLDCQLREKFL